MYYNYFRYYDPETGRYITSDPIGLAGGLNTYGYAYQNPIGNIDPDGRLVWFGIPAYVWITGGAATGATIWATSNSSSKSSSKSKSQTCDDDDNNKDCKKASKSQMRSAGIYNVIDYTGEHDFKRAWGAVPNKFFDICACKDGSIVIRAQGQCGKSGATIPTDARWK